MNYNMRYCTVLARILSDWGNVFYSCDKRGENEKCYIYDAKDCNTPKDKHVGSINLYKCIKYIESGKNTLIINKNKTLKKMEIAIVMYTISLKAYSKANLYKRSAYQIYKILKLFKPYEIYNRYYTNKPDNKKMYYTDELGQKAIRSLLYATEDLNMFELMKRKKDFGQNTIDKTIPLQYLLVDCEINRTRILVKDLELKSNNTPEKLKEYYELPITSSYGINYSIPARIYQLQLKSVVNYEAYKMILGSHHDCKDIKIKDIEIKKQIDIILNGNVDDKIVEEIFGEKFGAITDNIDNKEKNKKIKVEIFEQLIAETIYCFKEIILLSKTIGETYLFNHSFLGSMHEKLSFWIRVYETYKKDFIEEKIIKNSKIDNYLKHFLGEQWQELSGYYENQQALSHYYKCLETHNEGRAYHNMIDNMCFIKDDYNDRSDHFSIAEERHNILNGNVKEKIQKLKINYEKSKLYEVDNYF